ncbi:hypothetical protein [Geothrix sp. 21YS21S-4]|uniref:hypothetical protein n=1 Tax=Geothrix sp. 21YS21S-4 TaxID=3068889 RepID=UPI0027B9BFB4|nr:hypothetical protein [Geothrix sp. 21YS21S-4]
MLGRMKEAMADAAETLRRTFAGATVVAAPPEAFLLQTRGSEMVGAVGRDGLEVLRGEDRAMPLFRDAAKVGGLEPFSARVEAEAGWARWGAEATVLGMTPLAAGRATRMAVPPLPRRVGVAGRVDAPARPAVARLHEPLARPGTRRLDPTLSGGSALRDLEAVFAQPIAIRGEDIQHLPKGLWMRYSLQLVRETGENVRNLEVLGLFRIPRKGVGDLRHDPRLGRILVRLEPSAAAAARAPFILARRKDDGTLVSCFVEDR